MSNYTFNHRQFYLENISQVFPILPLPYYNPSPRPRRLSPTPLQSLLTALHVRTCFLQFVLHRATRGILQQYKSAHATSLLRSVTTLWKIPHHFCGLQCPVRVGFCLYLYLVSYWLQRHYCVSAALAFLLFHWSVFIVFMCWNDTL